MSGKNIKPIIPKSEINQLPKFSKPNEEIQLNFIGPISDNHRRFYILLSMDRYSEWPAAVFCKTPDGNTTVKFMKQFVGLNGIPKVIRTDQGTAFTS